jgi:hypothetical protein
MLKRSDGYSASSRLVAVLAIVWGLAVGLAAAGSRPAAPNPTPAAAPALASSPTPAAQATGFVGDDTCTTCHEPQGKALHATLHGRRRTPARRRRGTELRVVPRSRQAHVDSGTSKIKRFGHVAEDINPPA